MGSSPKNKTEAITLLITPNVKKGRLDTFKYKLGVKLGQGYHAKDFSWRIPVPETSLVGRPSLSVRIPRSKEHLNDWMKPQPRIKSTTQNETEVSWDLENWKEFVLRWTVQAIAAGYHLDDDPDVFIYSDDKITLLQPSRLICVHFAYKKNLKILSGSVGRRQWKITEKGIELVERDFPAGKALPFNLALRIIR